jgi:hypothetical protein
MQAVIFSVQPLKPRKHVSPSDLLNCVGERSFPPAIPLQSFASCRNNTTISISVAEAAAVSPAIQY